MTRQPTENDLNVCCYLKQQLEPRYRVVAEPAATYYSEWSYCYRVLDGDRVLHELVGDYRSDCPGALWTRAQQIVRQLTAELPSPAVPATAAAASAKLPIASRLIPNCTDRTYFSSGRAAFTYLVGQVIRPRCVYLPTFVCWSLIAAMQRRLPQIQLKFYSVDRQLNCQFPTVVQQPSALVLIHYFGRRVQIPPAVPGLTVLEDFSHLPVDDSLNGGMYAFGSLRKVYRTADGGFVCGAFNPAYEPTGKQDAWLRLAARDWRDLREAENMTDRSWAVADISSQSLAVVLQSATSSLQSRRQLQDQFLSSRLNVGQPLLQFGQADCPLLHNRLFSSREQRDSLRAYLASRGVFCSIHWPTHPDLVSQQDAVDVSEALWLEDHILSIPLGEHLGEAELERICTACDDWRRAAA